MSGLRQRKVRFEPKPSLQPNSAVKSNGREHSCLTKCFIGLLFCLCATLVVATVGFYNAPFTALQLKDFSVRVELTGPLFVNKKLTKGFKIFGLTGPESVVEDHNRNLYTGLVDGRIVKIASSSSGRIDAGKITNVTSGVIPGVPNAFKEQSHGRPGGLRLEDNVLYVADAGFGIYSIDLKTQQISSIVSVDNADPSICFANDLVITKDKTFIYFTDSSCKYQEDNVLFIFSEGVCDGRVMQYNIKTKEIRIVASELCFANGIELSSDEKYLFVPETFRYKIRIIDLSTWKTLRFVDVPDDLAASGPKSILAVYPGTDSSGKKFVFRPIVMPDNIRPTGHGTYWIAGGIPWNYMFAFMERNPVMRQIITGLLGHGGLMRSLDLSYNMLIEMNDNREIVQSLHDPDGELTLGLSQATPLSDGRLALGSHMAPFLSILDKKDVALGTQNA